MTEFLTQLSRKHELLSQVLTLTVQQADYISQDDTDSLLTNIGNRQKLIDEIDKIQAELPDKEVMRANPQCMTLITQVNDVLKAIQQQDTINEQAALVRMEDLRGQIRKVNEGRKTFSGYEGTGMSNIGGIYINKQK